MMVKTDHTSKVSCLLLVLGYVVLWLGVTSHEWRWEIGYLYGLWVRCDDDICTHYVTEFNSYIILVRCGMVLSLLMMTVTLVCLVLEQVQVVCSVRRRHVDTTHQIACVAAGLGEIVATASIGLYGCKTVMLRDRYPVLMGGFALTGCGIIISLLGNILKVMGPVSSWPASFPFLTPLRPHHSDPQVDIYSGGSEPCSADSCETHPGTISFGRGPNHCHRGRGLSAVCCCNKESSYNSVPSSRDSSSDVNYRHYEEISFDDMPPPPLELLRPISGDYSLGVYPLPHGGEDSDSQILRSAIVRNASHYPRAGPHKKSQPDTVDRMTPEHNYLNQNQFVPPPPPPPEPFLEPYPPSKPIPKARHQQPRLSGSRTKKRTPSPRQQDPNMKTRTLNHYTLSGAKTQQQETTSSRYKTLPCRASSGQAGGVSGQAGGGSGQARGGTGRKGNISSFSAARTVSYHGKVIGQHV